MVNEQRKASLRVNIRFSYFICVSHF